MGIAAELLKVLVLCLISALKHRKETQAGKLDTITLCPNIKEGTAQTIANFSDIKCKQSTCENHAQPYTEKG